MQTLIISKILIWLCIRTLIFKILVGRCSCSADWIESDQVTKLAHVFFYIMYLRQSYCIVTGEHLQICPQGSTCCTTDMETQLKSLSKKEYQNVANDAFRIIKSTFVSRTKKFDGKYYIFLL